jgi:hypothetical protein
LGVQIPPGALSLYVLSTFSLDGSLIFSLLLRDERELQKLILIDQILFGEVNKKEKS